MQVIRAFLAAIILSLSVPLQALVGDVQDTGNDAPPPVEQTIDPVQDSGADQRIDERIEGIFSELPAFENVAVDVKEGVVTLSGTVGDTQMIERAANIAGRVAGVATVENRLERDLSVEQNLSVLGRISELTERLLEALPLFAMAIATALAIGALGYVIARFNGLWSRLAPNAFLSELIRSAIRFAFVVAGVVIALDMLGAGALLGAVLGGAGVIGIALGFAMRDTIENYVASLMLSLRQPFRANDHVLIDDREGRVIRLTSRATILMTLDGNHLRIPNSQVFKAIIVNYTRNPQRRFDFVLGVDADDDPRAAMKLGANVLQGLPFVLNDPEPSARIDQVGDSNVAISFLAWVDQREADWYKSRSLAIAAVKEALEHAGFALPEPIYRLRFDARTMPLPIGNSGTLAELAETAPPTAPAAKRPAAPSGAAGLSHDVKPESEVAEMVEKERGSQGEQDNDLLDASRPVE